MNRKTDGSMQVLWLCLLVFALCFSNLLQSASYVFRLCCFSGQQCQDDSDYPTDLDTPRHGFSGSVSGDADSPKKAMIRAMTSFPPPHPKTARSTVVITKNLGFKSRSHSVICLML